MATPHTAIATMAHFEKINGWTLLRVRVDGRKRHTWTLVCEHSVRRPFSTLHELWRTWRGWSYWELLATQERNAAILLYESSPHLRPKLQAWVKSRDHAILGENAWARICAASMNVYLSRNWIQALEEGIAPIPAGEEAHFSKITLSFVAIDRSDLSRSCPRASSQSVRTLRI